MKDREYFFYPDWKERKKKFLRICNETRFEIRREKEIKTQKPRTKRIIIQDIK